MRSMPRAGVRIAHAAIDDTPLVVVSVPHALPPSIGAKLTPAEREVAMALVLGDSYAAIAHRRDTSERTIANQVRGIFRKLQVSSRGDLLRRVFRG